MTNLHDGMAVEIHYNAKMEKFVRSSGAWVSVDSEDRILGGIYFQCANGDKFRYDPNLAAALCEGATEPEISSEVHGMGVGNIDNFGPAPNL